MKVYFDNAATTKPYKETVEFASKTCEEIYYNPSSMHDLGLEAELAIKDVSKTISSIIKCNHNEIYYTSGGTEANNIAILGGHGGRQKKVITTKIEHPSVLKCFNELENRDVEVVYINGKRNGIIDIEQLENAIDENTSLVSIMDINNETGAVNNIEKIGEIIKNKNKNTLFHVDAVQSFCKKDINVVKSKIDMLSLSSHKIHGLKGTGALYVGDNIHIKPIFYGGEQQSRIRPGTENTFGIFAFGHAASKCYKDMKKANKKTKELKEYLTKQLNNLDDVKINSPDYSSPYILNISCGIKAEVLLHALEDREIYVSAGAACSSRSKNYSVLKEYGFDDEIASTSIRLSFSAYNTIKEADYFIDNLKKLLPVLKQATTA